MRDWCVVQLHLRVPLRPRRRQSCHRRRRLTGAVVSQASPRARHFASGASNAVNRQLSSESRGRGVTPIAQRASTATGSSTTIRHPRHDSTHWLSNKHAMTALLPSLLPPPTWQMHIQYVEAGCFPLLLLSLTLLLPSCPSLPALAMSSSSSALSVGSEWVGYPDMVQMDALTPDVHPRQRAAALPAGRHLHQRLLHPHRRQPLPHHRLSVRRLRPPRLPRPPPLRPSSSPHIRHRPRRLPPRARHRLSLRPLLAVHPHLRRVRRRQDGGHQAHPRLPRLRILLHLPSPHSPHPPPRAPPPPPPCPRTCPPPSPRR